MINHKILFIYLLKKYSKYFTVVTIILSLILLFSNAFDILQKFKNINLPSHFFWKLALFKIPYLINEVSPLISFITMLIFLKRLNKYNEIIIMLGSGLSFQKIILIPGTAAFIFGLIILAFLNPIGAYGLQQYENLEAKLTHKKQTSFVVSSSGVLFFEDYEGTNRIVQVKSLHVDRKELNDIILLFIDSNNNFLRRVDAPTAILEDNMFKLTNAKEINYDNKIEYENLIVPTNLSIKIFKDSFILPEMISVWNLPASIKRFSNSGLAIINYQIYYYKQIFKPFFMLTTVALASCFMTLRQRDNSQKKNFAWAIFIGFLVYCGVEISLRVFAYNDMQPLLAILLPIFLTLFLCNFVILHLQEG